MLTLAEAKRTGRCRLCGKRIKKTGGGLVYPVPVTLNFGDECATTPCVEIVPVTLNFGAEFAHTPCLEIAQLTRQVALLRRMLRAQDAKIMRLRAANKELWEAGLLFLKLQAAVEAEQDGG